MARPRVIAGVKARVAFDVSVRCFQFEIDRHLIRIVRIEEFAVEPEPAVDPAVHLSERRQLPVADRERLFFALSRKAEIPAFERESPRLAAVDGDSGRKDLRGGFGVEDRAVTDAAPVAAGAVEPDADFFPFAGCETELFDALEPEPVLILEEHHALDRFRRVGLHFDLHFERLRVKRGPLRPESQPVRLAVELGSSRKADLHFRFAGFQQLRAVGAPGAVGSGENQGERKGGKDREKKLHDGSISLSGRLPGLRDASRSRVLRLRMTLSRAGVLPVGGFTRPDSPSLPSASQIV